MNHVLFRWPDGSELVRFLDEATEMEWTDRVEREVNDQIRESKSGRSPFSFHVQGYGEDQKFFLMEPAGTEPLPSASEAFRSRIPGGRLCTAAFSVSAHSDGDVFMIDRVFPYHKVSASPSVTEKTWGLWEIWRSIPSFAERGSGSQQGEGFFLGFGLPWISPLEKSRHEDEPDRWPATQWVYDKIKYDAADNYRSGTWGAVVNGAKRIKGGQKPAKMVRIMALPDWEIRRRPRPWNLPGPSEHVWSAFNFPLDLAVVDVDDLDTALVKAGIVFWAEEEDGEWGRNAFVRRHAQIPDSGEVEQIHLLLGEVPPTMTLSTKELRVFVGL